MNPDIPESPKLLTVDQVRQVYADKLAQTNSHDAAFTKAVWVAFEAGIYFAGGEVSEKFKKTFLSE